MGEDENLIFIISIGLSIWALFRLRVGSLHSLFFHNNPGIGLLRLSVICSFLWVLIVISFFSDESIQGIYVVFYLVMGYALFRNLGQYGLHIFGLRLRVDVYERKNLAAAILFAAFTFSTALIFGGSLWGEADPDGDDEGGWWIPLTFFGLGWLTLVIAFTLFLIREKTPLSQSIRQDRKVVAAEAAAAYLVSSAIVIAEAAAGDFYGWWHGLMSFASLAGLVIVHEIFNTATSLGDKKSRPEIETSRSFEIAMYFVVAIASWLLNRWIDLYFARFI